MGEIAEMILDGILCQVCGVYLEDYADNIFPTSCEDCKEEE